MRVMLVAGALALIGCSSQPTLPPPGAQGPIEVVAWEGDDPRPTRLFAERITVQGDDMVAYELVDLDLMRPLQGGYLAVHADRGTMVLDGGGLTVDPPLRISGLLDGKPLIAISEALSYDTDTDRMALSQPRMAWSIQRPTAAELRVLDDRRYQADGWQTAAGEAPLAAVLGALPHQLAGSHP